MYLSVQESIFFTKFPSQYLLSDQVSTYRHSFIFINFLPSFSKYPKLPVLPLSVQVSINSNTEFCPNVLCPFRCLYIDIPFLGKMRFWPKISRKIDALTGVSLPQLRLRFVGKICYANQKMRCYASQRIVCYAHQKSRGVGCKNWWVNWMGRWKYLE